MQQQQQNPQHQHIISQQPQQQHIINQQSLHINYQQHQPQHQNIVQNFNPSIKINLPSNQIVLDSNTNYVYQDQFILQQQTPQSHQDSNNYFKSRILPSSTDPNLFKANNTLISGHIDQTKMRSKKDSFKTMLTDNNMLSDCITSPNGNNN